MPSSRGSGPNPVRRACGNRRRGQDRFRWRRLSMRRHPPNQRLRPREMLPQLLANRHKNDARPQLGNAEIGGGHQLPARGISQLGPLSTDVATVVLKRRIENPSNVFDHDHPRANLVNQTDSSRKQVPFILLPKLLSGDRKRGARQTARQQIDASEPGTIEGVQVALHYIPMRSIESEGRAGMLINLN